jgi:hypothetical protein
MSRADPPDLEGLRLTLHDAGLAVARAVLAIRRGDRLATEAHLIDAQRAIAVTDREAHAITRGKGQADE